MVELQHRPPREPLVAPGAIDHHISDLTVTVSAAVTLETLQSALAEHQQWLPVDGDPRLGVGVLVDRNSSGPLRLGFGAWRDLLLGVQFTTHAGQLITAGGRTMKNVAGYDLTKLMVGQYGLFGTLVTLTARTYRRPAAAILAQFPPDPRLIREFLPTALRPQWAMICNGSLWLGYLADDRAIDFYAAQVTARGALSVQRHTLDDDIRFRAANWLPHRADQPFRASVPPARVGDFLSRTHLTHVAADPAFGAIVGSCTTGERSVVVRVADELGGKAHFCDAGSVLELFTGVERELVNRLARAMGA